jgi:hypothetical protein
METQLVALSSEEAELVARLRAHNAHVDAFNSGLQAALEVIRTQSFMNQDDKNILTDRIQAKQQFELKLKLLISNQ